MTAEKKTLSRRTLVKGAAWSMPVIGAAVAAPLAAASTLADAGDFRITGTCGVYGLVGPGFTLTAGAVALPLGTMIGINGSGVTNIGVFSVTGGAANVHVLSGTSRQIILAAPLPAGATMAFRSTLSISAIFTMSADVTPPAGYAAGAAAKSSGAIEATGIFCGAN